VSTFDPEDYGLTPVNETVPRNWRRQMEADRQEAIERAEAAEARLEQLERDAVFAAAGIPSDGLGAVLRRGYDGELSVDAVRATLAPALGQQGYQEIQQSLAGHQQAQAMAAGAPPAGTTSTGSDIATLRAEARRKRNAGDFHTQRSKLGEVTNRDAVEPKPSGWILPKQLQQIQ
jgi:hypothetical protein